MHELHGKWKTAMIIQDRKAVSFHYTLTNQDGEQIETTRNKEPMTYLHGAYNIISGLESAMAGRSVGDEIQVTIDPAGAHREKNYILTAFCVSLPYFSQ